MKDKIKSIGAIAMMSGLYANIIDNENNYLKLNSRYEGPDSEPFVYSGSPKAIYRKSNLNNNQKKSRAKSKRAKKSRRNNR